MIASFFKSKSKSSNDEKGVDEKSDYVIEDEEDEDSEFTRNLRVNLSRLIFYAESADVSLQREVAEKLANEAVNLKRQVQIVENGGLRLLVPLTNSTDYEVQRLAAHALANLSVNSDNQQLMAKEGAIKMMIKLLGSDYELIQKQSAKALANLGVNADNKRKIAEEGGLAPLVRLADSPHVSVRIEAIAAIANLAVNDANELEIVKANGLAPIINSASMARSALQNPKDPSNRGLMEELAAQSARALRNLSVNPDNKLAAIQLGASEQLRMLLGIPNERVVQQARRALKNLEPAGDNARRK